MSGLESACEDLAGYRLAWRDGTGSVDGSSLRPDVLGRLAPARVKTTSLRVGGQLVRLGNVFSVEATSEPGTLRVPGSERFYRLGAGLSRGRLVVDGHAGDHVGEGMEGGLVEVRGGAGARPGAGMSGGLLRIEGSVGHRTGAPAPETTRGMTGGEILILGDAGDETGLRQRGGVIAVAGKVGSTPGYAMMAGTLVVGRGGPTLAGLRMRRGTIIFLERSPDVAAWHPGPHAICEGAFQPVVLALLFARLKEIGYPGGDLGHVEPFTAFDADTSRGLPGEPRGRGEILLRVSRQ